MNKNEEQQLNILFLGTSEFALAPLAAIAGKWPLVGVVTPPDRSRGRGRKLSAVPVKEYALSRGLPVWQPESVPELEQLLLAAEPTPDLVVLVAYGQFLSPMVLATPPLGCINLHPSLIPAYRGAAPIQRALINGERTTGVTTMYIGPGMDDGDVILQREVAIPDESTAGELSDLLSSLGSDLLLQSIELIARGRAPRLPQDERMATYAPSLETAEEQIDWQAEGERVCSLVRGMNPAPGAYTLLNGKIIKIWRTRPLTAGQEKQPPGTVLEADPKRGLVVQTGSVPLLVTELQLAGKKRMSGPEFLRGCRIKAGERFG
jgi:methionyl-tRNA formyltransferase